MALTYFEIEGEQQCLEYLTGKNEVRHIAFQGINMLSMSELLKNIKINECLFLGCSIAPELIIELHTSNVVLPQLNKPYSAYPNRLYTPESLYEGYDPSNSDTYSNCLDQRIYKHYIKTGKETKDIMETLARRLHDHSIGDAIDDFISNYTDKRIIAVMGGHSMSRDDMAYYAIAKLCKQLTEDGFLVISGGGPGAMEATHLGAWMAGKTVQEFNAAWEIVKPFTSYKTKGWLESAFEVRSIYPNPAFDSLGIPTWLYGHEPATPFASRIAKYFANSVREDGLLTLAKGGVIFAPGSAGTIQEIFQEATQNHYLSFGYASPMIFFDRTYWIQNRPIYPLFEKLVSERKYKNLMLSITDEIDEIIDTLSTFVQS